MERPAFQHLQIRKRGILPGGKKHRNHRASPLGKKPPDDGFIRTEGLFRIRHHIVVQRKIKNDQIRFKTKNIPLHTINTELGTGSADRRIDKFPAGARIFRPESLPDQRPITCPVRIGCVRPPCQGPAEKHDRQRISPLRAPVKTRPIRKCPSSSFALTASRLLVCSGPRPVLLCRKMYHFLHTLQPVNPAKSRKSRLFSLPLPGKMLKSFPARLTKEKS